MSQTSKIKIGKYRHYKGNMYEVLGIATHSEDESELVVYRTLYGNYDLWVRPLSMFTESVKIEGQDIARFAFVE